MKPTTLLLASVSVLASFATAAPAADISAAAAASSPAPVHGSDSNKHQAHKGHEGHADHKDHADHAHMEMEPSPASMHSGHHHGRKNILEDPNLEPQQRAYWEQYDPTTFLSSPEGNKFFLYSHIALNSLAWAFLYPVSLALSVAKSRFYLFAQLVQVAVFIGALLTLAVYGGTAPALYPGNSYSKMSVAMLFISLTHFSAAVIKSLSNWAVRARESGSKWVKKPNGATLDGAELALLTLETYDPYRNPAVRPSQDSGHAADSPDELSDKEDQEDSKPLHLDDFDAKPQNRLVARIMDNKAVYATVSNLGTTSKFVYSVLNRPLFVVGYGYLLMGLATLFCLGTGKNVFNILAHLIKGSVFFLYGVLTLLRYLGAFANRGMAWNIAPGSAWDPNHVKWNKTGGYLVKPRSWLSRFRVPSMEFVECSLILLYGSSNVFMERFANKSGPWSHMDLQHASIAFMYFGGGLCGMLVESNTVRRWVNRAISTHQNDDEDDRNSGMIGSLSVNPIPAFIVFWTGALMSQHEQALPLSSAIHSQWGYLLCAAAMFRLLTYALVLVSPPKSTVPSRPFTELLASFCLLCGGLVFMESNRETVEAMVWRALDSMFTLNVNVGVTALIMAWITVVMAVKAWATPRRTKVVLPTMQQV